MSDSSRFTVALVGFSAFESAAIGSFFRLAASRTPTYVQVENPDQGDFLIADADQPQAIDVLRAGGRVADTVFIGTQAPVESMARLPRPIEPRLIVRELDALVALRTALPVARPASEPGADPLFDDLETTVPGVLPKAAALRAAPSGGGGRDVLVVEDSRVAAKFLSQRLLHFGYRVHVAGDGEAAIELVTHQPFALAFVDVVLGPPGSIDGLRVCQYIKQRAAQARGPVTVVVMVTGLGGASDRVRGSLAGCDAYLVKPLLEAEFIKTLRAFDRDFAWTPAVR